MQWIRLKAFDLSRKFSNNFLIILKLTEAFNKCICPLDDPRHQEHSRSRSSTEDISFTLPHWISSSDLRMSCMVAGLLRISTVSASTFKILTPDHISPDFFNLLIDLIDSDTGAHDCTWITGIISILKHCNCLCSPIQVPPLGTLQKSRRPYLKNKFFKTGVSCPIHGL